jgi:hypothetical protein
MGQREKGIAIGTDFFWIRRQFFIEEFVKNLK